MDLNTKEQRKTTENTGVMKKKYGFVKKIIIGMICVLILLGTYRFLGIEKKQQVPGISNLKENTFYLATYHDTPILFYTFKGMMMTPGTPEEPDMGQYVAYEQPFNPHQMQNEMFVRFGALKNSRQLFSFERFAFIENVLLNDTKSFLVLSYIGGNNDATNYIYQVNLKTGESKKIWQHQVGTGNPPYNGGVAYPTQFIPDRYVIFSLVKGDPPPTNLPVGVIIKNVQSGTEKALGVAGDMHINSNGNTISYRLLGKIKVPCEGNSDPACFAGDKNKYIYTSTGEVVTQTLP